ncbi:hypothetical protein [Roseibium aggregatum]|uniref:hypothetical protein n=1 Tax=Roseibium aggregatum TaxID=187304 RepID=UPI003A975958
MHELFKEAFAYMRANWEQELCSTTQAAELIGINLNTFQTRLMRNQAIANRPEAGSRKKLKFTGYQLVHNMIADRLLQYGLPDNGFAAEYAEWVSKYVLSDPHYKDAVVRFQKREDGSIKRHVFEDGEIERWTGDVALVLPIGTMVTRLAVTLYKSDAKTHREHINRSLEAALAMDFDKGN